jgi:2-(1,2-epoxy-1,2-dihydrophenyl)acetyl-CoA isomerase
LKPSTVALARAQQVPQPLTVNSRHHQAIKDLAPGLVPVTASPDDLVEAFEDRARPWMAVQWHPEDLISHPAHKELFSGFIDSCRAFCQESGKPDLPLVEVSLAGETPVLRLNRPGHDNMLAGRFAGLLADSLEALFSDPTVPALVLTGSGRSFCRGTDPRYLAALLRCSDEAGYLEFLDTQARSILAVAGGTRPVLAALDGPAAGFGLSLALASDVRVVASRGREPVAFSPSASPGVPDLGSGATFLLPAQTGLGASSDFFFSGESLSIGRARELRLIDYWVEDGPARPFALARATAYSGQLPSVVSSLKSLLSTRTRPELLAALAREKEAQLSMFRSGELKKALPVPNRRPAKEPFIQ